MAGGRRRTTAGGETVVLRLLVARRLQYLLTMRRVPQPVRRRVKRLRLALLSGLPTPPEPEE